MQLLIDGLTFNVVVDKKDLQSKIPIIFLHGFTGCLEDWNFVKNKLPHIYSPVFIDLLGHGLSSSPSEPESYSFKNQINYLDKIATHLELSKFVLVGYSMGGRLALAYSVEFKNKILGLILESTSFGLKTEEEKKERIKSDYELAEGLVKHNIEEFINYWLNIPLFESLKIVNATKVDELIQRKIESNNITGLSNSLKGFSTGKMDNYNAKVDKITIPTLLITGEIDSKYSVIAKEIKREFSNFENIVVESAGHNVHFEKTEEFLKLLNEFLLNI